LKFFALHSVHSKKNGGEMQINSRSVAGFNAGVPGSVLRKRLAQAGLLEGISNPLAKPIQPQPGRRQMTGIRPVYCPCAFGRTPLTPH
jgi:hypothetical protein